MSNDNLSLDIGNKIKINGVIFTVDGFVLFEDSNGARWSEYKIRSDEKLEILWLSVDKLSDEYTLYSDEPCSRGLLEEDIRSSRYKKIYSKSAKILEHRGNVDADLGDEVFFQEYKDNTGKYLISVENWQEEQEFSKGSYINKNDIEKIATKANNMYNTTILHRINEDSSYEKNKISVKIIVSVILIIIVVAISLKACQQSNKNVSKFIKSNSNFLYETSVTSDLDEERKADIYSTNISIEETVKLIINGLEGNIEDVQENSEDGTVAIMTADELVLVYLSEDSNTLVQVSSREYVYSSRTTVYRGSDVTNHYYRSYYYNTGYSKDQSRYSSLINGYSDYKNDSFIVNDSNRYKTYSHSIRQSSVSTRSSSKGGVSPGK